uniref:phage tail protein n=1 Tax=Sandarakinorhabdus oryzae TaxID=2675220 RepID=UPI0018CC59F9
AAGRIRLRAGLSDLRVVASLPGGNQALAFMVTATALVATAELLPLRAHRGRALVNTPSGLAFDSGDTPLWPPIVEQPRRSFAETATLETPVVDAAVPGTIWDKLFIDGCLPPGTRLVVEARAGDDPDTLGDWRPQPQPLLSPSGSELVAHNPAARVPTDPASGRGSLTLLCQQLTGRHAQLRLTLSGDGQASPHLFALRLHFPRVSWNDRFLPALYREDAEAGDFLSRWLANMAGTSDQIDTRITHAQRWLNPQATPASALDWLASWFDVALDPAWDEQRRRAFIARAMHFFAWRGTMKGLTSALALGFNQSLDGTLFDTDASCTCEGAIRIVEQYRTRSPVQADRLAAATAAVAAEAAAWTRFQQQRGRTAPTGLPANNEPAVDWLDFLGLPSPIRTLWQRFLAARWRRISLLNQAHAAAWDDFSRISLPPVPPGTIQGAKDWQDFALTLLPIHQSAHRFTVLLPVRPGVATDTASLDVIRRLATRLIALEKPAHSIFDVRFYFAMNRVGEARLGLDTAIGQGSRAPELLPPAILGRAYAGESFIGPDGPATADRRRLAC